MNMTLLYTSVLRETSFSRLKCQLQEESWDKIYNENQSYFYHRRDSQVMISSPPMFVCICVFVCLFATIYIWMI